MIEFAPSILNADLSRPHPAGREETSLLLPFAERELPAGRHQFHKERLMAQIHEDLRAADADAARPVRTATPRNPFLRRPILLPVVSAFMISEALRTVARGCVATARRTNSLISMTHLPAPIEMGQASGV